MRKGDVVIWLPDPWAHGTGTIGLTTRHGWLWVNWADGHWDQYDPQHLEHVDTWIARTMNHAAPGTA